MIWKERSFNASLSVQITVNQVLCIACATSAPIFGSSYIVNCIPNPVFHVLDVR